MVVDLWLPKMMLLSRRELGINPFPFSCGDFNSSVEESDNLVRLLFVAEDLRGKARPLVPGDCRTCHGV